MNHTATDEQPDGQPLGLSLHDQLGPLPEHWMTAELRGATGSFQRAAREYAEEYARAYAAHQVAAERERQPALPPCSLTWAIQRLNSTPYAMTKDECVEMLRGLRSEIQALSGPNGLLKGARDEA